MTDEPVSEAKIEFPCDYPIKVIVEMRDGLVEEIVAIMQRFDANVSLDKIEQQPSKKGKYVSIRVPFWATGTDQLRDLFEMLKQNSQVRMVL